MKPTVNILLSTYNGEKYLEQQLHSLLSQQHVTIDILVRDDGSTDRTCDILDRWQQRGQLTWYKGENMGWAMSFMHLLAHSHDDADYYAFCDQDDIWLPEKLLRATSMIAESGREGILYCSNANYYRNGHVEGLIKPPGLHYDLYTAMVKCITVGCTMVFDKVLATEMKQHLPRVVPAHDFWVYQVASSIGTVCYDDTSNLLYRQHAHNQIGQKRTFSEIWTRRMKTLRTFWHDHSREEMAIELLRCHGDKMPSANRAAVEEMAHYRKSVVSRLRLFFDKRYTMGHFTNDFFLRLRILLGKV